MNFNRKGDLLSDMLGIELTRTRDLELALQEHMLSNKKASVATLSEALAPQLLTNEESFYIGYLIGAITHHDYALPA